MLIEGALVYSVLRARYAEVLRLLSCQFVSVTLLASLALFLFTPLPPEAWPEASAARQLESRDLTAAAAALPVRSYYVALNLFNNEPIMGQLQDQLLLLAEVLGEANVYVSVWENGSRDGTKVAMAELSVALGARGIRHSVVAGNSSWWDMCPLLATPALRHACDACEFVALRNCAESVRIPVMALIRNMALLPLFGVDSVLGLYTKAEAAAAALSDPGGGGGGANPATYVARHLGLSRPTHVIFLNDVLLYARDVVELLATEGGRYDLACAADFESLQLYDVWVARDLHGASLSGWYPHVRERAGQARLIAGQPFRVYSCWNGIVALPADTFVSEGILFRSWRPGEVRSLHALANASQVWSDACPASECHLVSKDLWAAGRSRIFINPRVRVVYNAATEMAQRVWMPLVNGALLSWANRIGQPHHALRSGRVMWPVGSHHPANDPPGPAAARPGGEEAAAAGGSWWPVWPQAGGGAIPTAAAAPPRPGFTSDAPRGARSQHQLAAAPAPPPPVAAAAAAAAAVPPSPNHLLAPPLFVACGLSDDDVLPNGFKQNITTAASARRPPRPTPSPGAGAASAWGDAAG